MQGLQSQHAPRRTAAALLGVALAAGIGVAVTRPGADAATVASTTVAKTEAANPAVAKEPIAASARAILGQFLTSHHLTQLTAHGFAATPVSAAAGSTTHLTRGGFNVVDPSGDRGSIDVQVSINAATPSDVECASPACVQLDDGSWLVVSQEAVPNDPTRQLLTVTNIAKDGRAVAVTARNYTLTTDGKIDRTTGPGTLPASAAALQSLATSDSWKALA